MKKLVAMLTILLAVLCMSGAMAEDTGVQIISAPNIESEPVSMDDIKLGKEIDIEGYGVITPVSCEVYDKFGGDYNIIKSGDEAQFYVLVIEILNKQYVPASYVESVTVEAEFGEGYKFGGWHRQFASSKANYVNVKGAFYEINPLYVGKYAFGVTVPNFVAESTEPLSITVTLSDDIVLTYHVRK